jgi:RsiW-degrading membrane proteinase PrsW (M82 family)
LGKARFADEKEKKKYLILAFIVPIILHGIYDFILFSQSMELMLLFIPYMLYLWKRGLGNVDELSGGSRFSFRSNKENKK